MNNLILSPSFDINDRPLVIGNDLSQMIDITKSGASANYRYGVTGAVVGQIRFEADSENLYLIVRN